MTRFRFICLIIGLWWIHSPTARAATKASLETASESSLTQSNSDTVKTPVEQASPLNTELEPISSENFAPLTMQKGAYMMEGINTQRAWMYSALVPGWGQCYNGHYWKVPVMYALWGALGWGAVYNHKVASDYPPGWAKEDLKRSRDLCVIFMGLLYIINIFDAYAGASLKTFDLSNDISMQIQPPKSQDATAVGLSLSFKL